MFRVFLDNGEKMEFLFFRFTISVLFGRDALLRERESESEWWSSANTHWGVGGDHGEEDTWPGNWSSQNGAKLT